GEGVPSAPRGDLDLAFQRQAGTRRAVEIAPVDAYGGRAAGHDDLVAACKVELDAVGNEILHQEGGFGDRVDDGIGVDAHLPRAAHGVRRQVEIDGLAAHRPAFAD